MGRPFATPTASTRRSPPFAKPSPLVPTIPTAHIHLSGVLLLTGNFSDGWGEYEWRLLKPRIGHRPIEIPQTPMDRPGSVRQTHPSSFRAGSRRPDPVLPAMHYSDTARSAHDPRLSSQQYAPALSQPARRFPTHRRPPRRLEFDYHCYLLSLPLLPGAEAGNDSRQTSPTSTPSPRLPNIGGPVSSRSASERKSASSGPAIRCTPMTTIAPSPSHPSPHWPRFTTRHLSAFKKATRPTPAAAGLATDRSHRRAFRLRRHRRVDRQSRSGHLRRHLRRPPRRGDGQARLDATSLPPRSALAARSLRFPLVSHDAAFSARRAWPTGTPPIQAIAEALTTGRL